MTAPLTIPEYNRLFQVLHGVVMPEAPDPTKACLFFNLAGAFLLSEFHGIDATPVAGAAAYNLRTPTNLVLVQGRVANGSLVSDSRAFHCWISIGDWIVDFTSPLFQDMVTLERAGARIEPRMFVRQAVSPNSSLKTLDTPGAYLHVPNSALMRQLAIDFSKREIHQYLIKQCGLWYARYPQVMPDSFPAMDAKGRPTLVKLSDIQIQDAW